MSYTYVVPVAEKNVSEQCKHMVPTEGWRKIEVGGKVKILKHIDFTNKLPYPRGPNQIVSLIIYINSYSNNTDAF